MPYVGNPFCEIVQTGDYMTFFCWKCKAACDVDYLGLGGPIPIMKVTCPKCGELSESKVGHAGLGFLQNSRKKWLEKQDARSRHS